MASKLQEGKRSCKVVVELFRTPFGEYDRVGVGMLNGKVFVCDLEVIDYDDVLSENDLKCFWFVKFESVEECCLSGVKFGWCDEWKRNEGYGVDDRFRMKSYENEEDGDVDGFDKWIEVNEVSE